MEASEIITSSPYKRKLRQDQEKKIETNKNQIKTKQQKTKSKLKQIVKLKNYKKLNQKKKVMLKNKNELSLFVKRLPKRLNLL